MISEHGPCFLLAQSQFARPPASVRERPSCPKQGYLGSDKESVNVRFVRCRGSLMDVSITSTA